MHISPGVRWVLRIGTAITLAFIYIPLIVIAIYAFNESRSQAWPIDGFTLEWFDRALNNPGVRDAFWTSMKAALGATAVALLLGTLAALAVSRYRFFGRETISFLIILPLALPGIVTGMALNSTFTQVLGIDLSLFTVIVGPRHLLHRRRVQQRGGAAAAQRHVARGGVHGPGRQRLAHVPPRDLPDAAHRTGGRAACWRSRCRSTRSSSPPSRSGTSRRCRSGSSPTTRGRTSCRS